MARKASSVVLPQVAEVRDRINKQLKAEVIFTGSDPRFNIDRVSTGILTIDRLLGGGIPRGRTLEMFGDWHAGKTYLILSAIAAAQRRDEVGAYIDTEHTFDAKWFTLLGGDPTNLLLYYPTTAEEVINTLQLLEQHKDEKGNSVRPASLVGVDSVAALLPREELEHNVEDGDDRIASLARTMSRLLRRITMQNDQTIFLFSNQWRDKIGGYAGKDTPGGRALEFYSSIRVELAKTEKERQKGKIWKKGIESDINYAVGQWIQVKTVKDKTKSPQAVQHFMFDFAAKMVDLSRELLDLGLQDFLITRTGNMFSYTTDSGREIRGLNADFRSKLMKDDEARIELTRRIQAKSILLGVQ